MNFARAQLEKYGWTEGKGLGVNESGIAEPLKPKLKFDTCGIGHDAAEQFTNHWWENTYNRASENINISSTENGVAVVVEDDSFKISASKHLKSSLKTDSDLLYGNFLKTSTLTADGNVVRVREEEPEDSPEPENLVPAAPLTDEELLKACGGLTAHKGARHGLTLSGKLSRIEEQERIFLTARMVKEGVTEVCVQVEDPLKRKDKKKKRKSEDVGVESEMKKEDDGGQVVDEEPKKKKKSKKHEGSDVPGDMTNGTSALAEEEEVISDKKKKKKKKQCEEPISGDVTNGTSELAEEEEGEEGIISDKKKKKRKKKQHEESHGSEEVASEKNKKDKQGESDVSCHVTNGTAALVEEEEVASGKKKKKKRKHGDTQETQPMLNGSGCDEPSNVSKKKEKRVSFVDTDAPSAAEKLNWTETPEGWVCSRCLVPDDEVVSKKKKNKKTDNADSAIQEGVPACQEGDSLKKKKKKKNSVNDDVSQTDTCLENPPAESSEESVSKKKKKRKHGSEDPATDVADEEMEQVDLSSEKKKKKKKRKKQVTQDDAEEVDESTSRHEKKKKHKGESDGNVSVLIVEKPEKVIDRTIVLEDSVVDTEETPKKRKKSDANVSVLIVEKPEKTADSTAVLEDSVVDAEDIPKKKKKKKKDKLVE